MISSKITTSILIIYTGGTIGMMEDPLTGGLEPFDFHHLLIHVPELRRFGFEIASVEFDPSMDSSEMTPEVWGKLVGMITDNYALYDGFVILHGTDTMAYTASALSFMLENLTKPVILTGSQLPIGMLRTDGKENLIGAIEIAAAKRDDVSIVREVCIYFQNKLLRGNRTSKVNSENFNAFRSSSFPPLAFAGIHINYTDHLLLPITESSELVPHCRMDSGVIVLRLFPGISSEVIGALLAIPGLRGVVLETYGSGNAPRSEWFVRQLKEAVSKGVVIVNVSQCAGGSVDMSLYGTGRFLQQMGVVSGFDSTTEAAVTKLMFLLAHHDDPTEVAQRMIVPLAGEITV